MEGTWTAAPGVLLPQMALPLTDPILQLTVLLAIALGVQLTMKRAHVPGLVGLLLVGMVVGPGGLAVLPEEPVVSLLGDIGLVYLMFMAGLEVDLDTVRARRGETLAFGVLAFLFSLVPAIGLGLLLGFDLGAAVLLGTLLSSHTLLAWPILADLKILGRGAVVLGIGGTLVTDTLALLTLAVTLQVVGENGGAVSALVPLVSLAGLTALALWGVPRLSRLIFLRTRATLAEQALYVLTVLLVLATFAEVIGTHEVLGAFLAGVALNRPLRRRDQTREHVEFVGRMLFIPFFFVATGMLMDLEVLRGEPAVWGLAGALLLVIVAGKTAAAWLVGAWTGLEVRDRLLVASLTFPQAAATLAVTLTARRVGLFDEVTVDAVLLVIFVTCLGGPLLTRAVGRRLEAPRGRGQAPE